MTDQPIDTWVTQALPPGSGRYYALLHVGNDPATGAVLTLISIWSKLCFSNREIEAARKQLEWWREELDREAPRHPVTQALKTSDPDHFQHAIAHLKEVLMGYGSLLIEGSPSRAQPAATFHHRTGAHAALSIAGPVDDNPQDSLQHIGIALSQLRCIRHMHNHVSNGLLCLPFETMSEAGVSPTDLVRGHYPTALEHFLQQQLSDIELEFERFYKNAPTQDGFRFLFIYTRLQHRLLKRYRQDLTRLDDPNFRVTPLRNFCDSWIANRQFSRR